MPKLLAVTAFIGALTLAGCGETPEPRDKMKSSVPRVVDHIYGRMEGKPVECLVYEHYDGDLSILVMPENEREFSIGAGGLINPDDPEEMEQLEKTLDYFCRY